MNARLLTDDPPRPRGRVWATAHARGLRTVVDPSDRSTVARHTDPDNPPRPATKPPYRLFVAIGGVVVLTLVAMAIVAAIYPERAPTAAAGAATTGMPRPTVVPTTTPGRPGPPPATGTAPTGPPPLPGAVTGTYAVVHTDQELGGGRFEVRINLVNSATVAQPWVVTLAYPQRVTAVVAAWTVPGGQTPVLITSRPTFTLTGTQPIPAVSMTALWLQLTVDPGTGLDFTQCRVNATPCTYA
jgi:hypothetical protein